MLRAMIRDALPADFTDVCALNLLELRHTSPMSLGRLAELAELSCYLKVATIDHVISGFLLAMPDSAPYENDNFAWFLRHFQNFVYIDRIVVSPAARGLGIGSLLYNDLFRFARERGIARLACEINIDPPNESSRAFHAALGFREQGRQWLASSAKTVSLQVAEL